MNIKFGRLSLLLFLFILFCLPAVSETTANDLSVQVSSDNGNFVMGRPVTSEFYYEIDELKPVQVSFVIDDTGSMGGQITDIKNNIKNFFDQLGPNARGSIVTFQDSPEIDQTFTTSGSTLESTVDSISAGGGGDCEEDAYGGLDTSLNNLNWENGERKIVILVVGAGVHDPNGIRSIDDEFANQGYKVFTVTDDLNCGGYDAVANDLPDTTGGSHYSFGTDWSLILDEVANEAGSGASADLNAVIDPNSYSTDFYDSSDSYNGHSRYNFNDVSVDGGSHSISLDWVPTDHGNFDKKTGDSYLEIDQSDGNTVSYSFSSQESMNVDYVDFNVLETSIVRDSGIEVNFTVRNEGTIESLQRQVWIADGTGGNPNYENYTINPLSPGQEQSYSIDLSSSNSVFTDAEPLYIRADPEGQWDGTPYGHGDTMEPNEANNVVSIGYPPRLDNIAPVTPGGVAWGDTFQPELTYAHPNPGNVDGVYNYTNDTMRMGTNEPMSSSVSSGDAVLTTQQDYFADIAERWYNFTVRAEDDKGAKTIHEESYYVENPKPTASALNPKNNGLVPQFPVTLKAAIRDSNSEYHQRSVNVTFYDHNNQQLARANLFPQATLTHNWDVPTSTETDYTWKVEIEDKWDETNTTFSFTKVIGRSYRTGLTVNTNYSSIVLNAQDSKYTEMTVRNNVQETKNITVNLTGVEAEFLDGTSVKTISNLEGQSSRDLAIRITPDEATNEDLVAVIMNNNIGVKTEKRIDVTVLPESARSNDVPGIGLVHLLFIAVGATVLYSAQF